MRGDDSVHFPIEKSTAVVGAIRRGSYDDGLVTAQFEINSCMGVSARSAGI
jgi:hypothetical protein